VKQAVHAFLQSVEFAIGVKASQYCHGQILPQRKLNLVPTQVLDVELA
jgi:hypothetical protein